jgi:hypothetical protein
MKYLKIFPAILLLAGPIFMSPLIAATQNFSSNKPSTPLAPPETPLTKHQVGEKLDFDVHWMGLHVGYGSLEVKEIVELRGRKAYHVIAVARTNEALSTIYPVRDEIHSYIDVESFHSLEFRKVLSERRYRADERVIYDYDKKKGYYESLLNGSKKEMDIPVPVHDIVSLFYWFRLQSVKVGDAIRKEVNSDEKNQDVELLVMSREEKEMRGKGVVDTFLVEPKTRVKGVLYSRGKAWVHFTTDRRRVPVLIVLKTPFGRVTGVLRELPQV